MTSSDKNDEDEYEYTVEVTASEAFKNAMATLGVIVNSYSPRVMVFVASRLVDLKPLKRRGIIGSYHVTRIKRVREPTEESG